MLLLMPLGDWFLTEMDSPNNPQIRESIGTIRSWPAVHPEGVWLSAEDLPEDLRGHYSQLGAESLRSWCVQSDEWESLRAMWWQKLLVVPFGRVPARIAALHLKTMAESQWARRSVEIAWSALDPAATRNQDTLIGSLAWTLWDAWYRNRAVEVALNLTACPTDLGIVAGIAASLVRMPVYCWSQSVRQMLYLPAWGMTFNDDREWNWLCQWLKGVWPEDASQDFLARWCPVVGNYGDTTTALVLREWFEWNEKLMVHPDPISIW